MAQANASKKQIRYAAQTWGFAASVPTGGSAPKLTNYRSTDWTMSAGKTSAQSDELRADSMPADSTVVGFQGSAQSNFEFSYNTHNVFFEGVFRNTYTASGLSTTGTAFSTPSGTLQTITVTSSANFVAKQWCKVTGAANATNNSTFLINSIPGGTSIEIVNSAGVTASSQTATVTASRMLRMGSARKMFLLEGEYSDTNAFQRLESAIATQINLTLATQQKITGQVQFLGKQVFAPIPIDVQGAGTAGNLQFTAGPPGTITGPSNTWTGGSTVFAVGDFVKVTGAANAANNGTFKVSVVTSTVLTVTNTDASAKTFTAENSSTALVQKYQTVGDAIPTAATTTKIMNASTNIGFLTEGGVTLGAAVQSFDITINGNAQPVTQVGSSALAGVTDGTFAVTGTLTAFYENNTLYSKLLADTETSFSGRATDADGNIAILTLPRMKFTQGDPGGGGQNTLIPLPLQYAALLDATTNTLVQIDLL